MCKIIAGISEFYRECVADVGTIVVEGKQVVKTKPLSRMEFLLKGSAAALLLLVQRCAHSVFFLIATVFTCGLNKNFRDSLLKNVQDVLVGAGVIVVALVGALFPQTINQKVLQIPIGGESSNDYLLRQRRTSSISI